MKQSGFQLTLIAVVVLVASIGIAAVLSALTDPDSAIVAPGGDESLPPASQSGSSSGQPTGPKPSPTGGLPGGNQEAVQQGRLPGFEDQDINADPDTFCYLLNSGVTLEKPDGPANIMVENDPGNLCPMQLCYYLEDTEELVYTSAILQPGEHISTDTLSVKLKKGEYSVNAVISVYDELTNELKTTFHESVNLKVNQKILGIF